MTEFDELCLCAFQEAAGEPDDGVAAVVQVVLNRTRLQYASDGTIAGTIECHAQFSWTEYAMENGVYTRVARTPADEGARIRQLLTTSQNYPTAWARVQYITGAVQAGSYIGSAFANITTDTVLYLNPKISERQAWQIPQNFVCTIGHHDFYRDPPRSGPVAAAADATDFAQAATKAALG